ncbi:MAG: flagellar motor protein MotB [Lachnospiraceae bacterium]|nr:flagellar motor protein MotB [Lachnospiraceae bacterium]
MANRKPDEPPKGAPAWQSTFADLMNLLLCFFVLLFSMSTIDAQKFEQIAASFSQTFSIFSSGSTALGEGTLVGSGVSQLNNLDEYMSDTGYMSEESPDADSYSQSAAGQNTDGEETGSLQQAEDEVESAKLKEAEELGEKIEEALFEGGILDDVQISVTADYVQLTINGSLLFDSGSAELKAESTPVMTQVALILERYAGYTITIEGHTDNVPIHSSRFANNNELSSARAISVFDFLTENTALDPAKIIHAGRGEYVPIADNSTPEGRSLNRRVEIKIYHRLSDQ